MLGALPTLGALAGLVLLAYVATPYLSAAREASRDVALAPWWVLAAAGLLGVHYVLIFNIWRGCLLATGATLSNAQIADTYVPALLARYVPGKIWSHGVRMAIARRAGLSLASVTGAIGWEILLVLTTGGFVALVALHRPENDERIRMATVLLTLAGVLAVVVVRMAGSREVVAGPLRRLGFATERADTRVLLRLGVVSVIAWLVYGFAHWCLARAFGPMALSVLPLVTGAVALAWAGGYLSVIMPAGLGVRDGLLALFLAPLLGAGPVVLFAATARLLSIALEMVIFAGWSWWRFRGVRRSAQRAGH